MMFNETGDGTSGIQGVVVGEVTDNEDPEDMGRVKVQFPWREADDETYWARMARPMAGGDMGTYFLPEVVDECRSFSRWVLCVSADKRQRLLDEVVGVVGDVGFDGRLRVTHQCVGGTGSEEVSYLSRNSTMSCPIFAYQSLSRRCISSAISSALAVW